MVDEVNTYELDKRATELAVEEFQSTFDSVSASLESLKKEMEELKVELREERSKRKKAEAMARKLDQQLNLVWNPQIWVWLIPNIMQTKKLFGKLQVHGKLVPRAVFIAVLRN